MAVVRRMNTGEPGEDRIVPALRSAVPAAPTGGWPHAATAMPMVCSLHGRQRLSTTFFWWRGLAISLRFGYSIASSSRSETLRAATPKTSCPSAATATLDVLAASPDSTVTRSRTELAP
jgi:hypothetical protein